MKKETFIKLIELIQQNEKIADEFVESISNFFDGAVGSFSLITEINEKIIDILEDEFSDNFTTIEWWLFDAPHAGKNRESAWIKLETKEKIELETASQLYDYLNRVKNEKEKET
jgi:hypothetical protein